eukprot:31191-Pelagococcus_subviridis.AAC.22
MDVRFTVPAQSRINFFPTAVLPVNDSFRTISDPVIASPIAFASPITNPNTPLGIPARAANSASASADSGVSSEGLTTTTQPAASAAAAFRVIIASGKFHGVIAAHTPTGCRSAKTRAFASCVGMTSP